MSGDVADQIVFVLVVALRLIVPLAIPRFPLPAIVAAMLIDAGDLNVFQWFTDLDLANYQGYDKALDVYYLTVAYLSTFRNWSSRAAFEAGRFLIYVRLAGVVLFETTGNRGYLLLFPNTFEYFFIFYEAVGLRWTPSRISRQLMFAAAGSIWVMIKLPQEYWIHVAELDVTEQLAAHVAVIPTVGVAIALLFTAARWILSTRLPAPDRRLSWTGAREEPSGVPAHPNVGNLVSRVVQRSLAEKLVLVSMVCVVFGQVSPAVRSETIELIVGVSLLILANTIVSESMSGRGVGGWSSTLSQFAATAAVNAVLAVLFSVLLPLWNGAIHIGNTLFFLLLLTLLVSLYDRYRPFHAARATSHLGHVTDCKLAPSPTSA